MIDLKIKEDFTKDFKKFIEKEGIERVKVNMFREMSMEDLKEEFKHSSLRFIDKDPEVQFVAFKKEGGEVLFVLTAEASNSRVYNYFILTDERFEPLLAKCSKKILAKAIQELNSGLEASS